MQINNIRRFKIVAYKCLFISIVLLILLSPISMIVPKQYNHNKTINVEVCDTIGVIEPDRTEDES